MTQLAMASPSFAGLASVDDVRIRPYGAHDEQRLLRMSQRLSRRSLYHRFFAGTPHLPDNYVRSLRTLDHWDREAIVAVLDGELIGTAEYVRDATRPCDADLAVLVADSWQRHGLARILVTCLGDLALRRRITAFRADLLLENREALAALRTMWPTARPTWDGTSARFHLPLTPS
ncbi:GNAT family N-acetyltransferase [Actinomadura miaoliensis]|uniref:N-acetyltransferase domain-containing protein n=1 Tax=Actinomadura miaoliensis TaxID=430685 RepID=A0ABP7X5L7_9ACTN